MYTLDCKFYTKEFKTIDELVQDVLASGMDPNYTILKNKKSIGEKLIDFLQF